MRLVEAGVRGQTEAGSFQGSLIFDDGLFVITGPNRHGKSLLFSAIAWCLGVEHIYGTTHDDSSIFSDAARIKLKYIKDGIELETKVIESEAFLRISNEEREVTLTRSITKARHLIRWSEEDKTTVYATGYGSYLNETAGFQHHLLQWIGIPKRNLINNRGKEAGIYFENIAPLFLIEQLGGWSDIQSEQTYRYGTREINEGSFELLLGNDILLSQRLNDQADSAKQASLKSEIRSLASIFDGIAKDNGWTLEISTHGQLHHVIEKAEKLDLAREIHYRYGINIDGNIETIKARIDDIRQQITSGYDDNNQNKALADITNRSIELKSLKIKQEGIIERLSDQIKNHEHMVRSIEYQISSAKDLARLQRDGIGQLDKAICPTCHQDVSPTDFEHQTEPVTLISTQIEQLNRNRELVCANLARTELELIGAIAKLDKINEDFNLSRKELTLIKQLSSPEKEAIVRLSFDLIAEERNLLKAEKLKADINRVQDGIDNWVKRAGEIDGFGRIDPLSTTEVSQFLKHLRTFVVQTGCAGIAAGDGSNVNLDTTYQPILRERLLRSYGSASDRARMVIAYCFALLMSARQHPGFLVLDEPLQQNPDKDHRQKFVNLLKSFSKISKQVIILTNLNPDEIDILIKSGLKIRLLDSYKFLSLDSQG